MSLNNLFLIAGLGNPGKKYENTRHNAGFLVLDKIAEEKKLTYNKKKFNAQTASCSICNSKILLTKPLSYMNLSGDVIRDIVLYYKININNIIIVHDDLDIEFGKIKIKKKGGDGGHKGIKSIISALNNNDFIRIRIGIGPYERDGDITHYVLGNFNNFEKENISRIVNTACETIYTILLKGLNESMNNFNNKQILV